MSAVLKAVALAAAAAAALSLAGLVRRRRASSGPPWLDPPAAGVREPRRPLLPSGSATAAAGLPG